MAKKEFRQAGGDALSRQGKIEGMKLGDVTAMGVRFEPGWKWSECVKPSCQVSHLMHVVSGRMRMDDGTEAEFGADDVGVIPPATMPEGRGEDYANAIYENVSSERFVERC